jgi:hypothetical protein
MSTIIIRGIRAGQFKRLIVKNMNELIYGLIESAIFRMAVLNQDNTDEILDAMELAITSWEV